MPLKLLSTYAVVEAPKTFIIGLYEEFPPCCVPKSKKHLSLITTHLDASIWYMTPSFCICMG